MKVNIRKSNHSERKSNKKSEWLYVVNDKKGLKKVILTRDKNLIKSNPNLDIDTYKYYLGEDSYFEMLDKEHWITYYNKYAHYSPKYSIQIEVSNIKGLSQLIFEDSSILYNVENVNVEGKEFCRVNLEEYNINLYLPITTQIEYKEIKNDI